MQVATCRTWTFVLLRSRDIARSSYHLLAPLPIHQHFWRVAADLRTLHKLYVSDLQLRVTMIRIAHCFLVVIVGRRSSHR